MRINAKVGKLRLNLETLRALDKPELENVIGGAASANLSCIETSCNGCNTKNTCTTRYC
jgi:hypothetical protein